MYFFIQLKIGQSV